MDLEFVGGVDAGEMAPELLEVLGVHGVYADARGAHFGAARVVYVVVAHLGQVCARVGGAGLWGGFLGGVAWQIRVGLFLLHDGEDFAVVEDVRCDDAQLLQPHGILLESPQELLRLQLLNGLKDPIGPIHPKLHGQLLGLIDHIHHHIVNPHRLIDQRQSNKYHQDGLLAQKVFYLVFGRGGFAGVAVAAPKGEFVAGDQQGFLEVGNGAEVVAQLELQDAQLEFCCADFGEEGGVLRVRRDVPGSTSRALGWRLYPLLSGICNIPGFYRYF